MKVPERNKSILKHIVSYCDQIDMAVEQFGCDYEIFLHQNRRDKYQSRLVSLLIAAHMQ